VFLEDHRKLLKRFSVSGIRSPQSPPLQVTHTLQKLYGIAFPAAQSLDSQREEVKSFSVAISRVPGVLPVNGMKKGRSRIQSSRR
jgi:hypothetical protein